MTDKQIIIDGVDVSGCDFLAKKDDYCSYSGVTYAYKGQCMCSDEEMCKEHPKCFYKKVLKQLKHKEQELQEAIDNYVKLDNQRVKEYNELVDKYNNKEQECEELKATLKVIADRPCLNINDCNGNCLPHCKWNAHKLAQEALKELE